MARSDTFHADGVRRLFEITRRVSGSTDLAGVLEEIAQGVVEGLGYGVAAISRLEGDILAVTAVGGPEELREQLVGRRTRASLILEEFKMADHWGILRFLPHERLPSETAESLWVPDLEISDDPDAWHPLDTLYAPLYSSSGVLLGNMSVDLPPDNKVPDQQGRELLEMFVVQAGLALEHAQRREQLSRQVRLGEALKTLAFAVHRDLDSGLRDAAQALSEALRRAAGHRALLPRHRRRPGRARRRLARPATGAGADRLRRPGRAAAADRRGPAAALRGDRRGSGGRGQRGRPGGPAPPAGPRLGQLPAGAGGRRPGGAGLPRGAAHRRAARLRGRRGRRGPRGRPRARPAGLRRPRTPDRVAAGARAARARPLQGRADRHHLPRAQDPAHLDHGPHRAARGRRRAAGLRRRDLPQRGPPRPAGLQPAQLLADAGAPRAGAGPGRPRRPVPRPRSRCSASSPTPPASTSRCTCPTTRCWSWATRTSCPRSSTTCAATPSSTPRAAAGSTSASTPTPRTPGCR